MEVKPITALSVWIVIYQLFTPVVVAQDKPDLMLAGVYRENIDVKQYWISEKLDGVRARWDGKKLISRGGLVFAAPKWFVEDFPDVVLDGELWIGRGRYEDTVSVVRRLQPHSGWNDIRFMVFDLPGDDGIFSERLKQMEIQINSSASPYLGLINHFKVQTHAELKHRLQWITDAGGEGLMLHKGSARYGIGRSHNLLKYKLFNDAEAVVIGYRAGSGKYLNMTGSLKVRDKKGNEFYVGSGLSDALRRHPPTLGKYITFRHQGLTKNGIPRFPVFLRIRDEVPD